MFDISSIIKISSSDQSYKKIAIVSVLICLIFQLLSLYVYWDMEQVSDWREYVDMAKDCYSLNQWYPNSQSIYQDFIWTPGLINLMILQLKLFGTLRSMYFINLVMHWGITFSIYYISKRIYGLRTALIAISLYSLIGSNWFIHLPYGTEVPFVFFGVLAICCILNGNNALLILSGILLVIANWFRPLTVVFIVLGFIYMLVMKYKWYKYVLVFVPMVMLFCLIGLISKNNCGYFITQSSTGGYNLIMTSHDDIVPGECLLRNIHYQKDSYAYIQNKDSLTYLERDSVWMKRAKVWIMFHPVKYSLYATTRIFSLYHSDAWTIGLVNGNKSLSSAKDNRERIVMLMQRIVFNLVYAFVMIVFILSIYIKRKEILSKKGVLLMYVALVTVLTIPFPCIPRYHYPMLFAITILAANVIVYVPNKRFSR